VGEYRFITRWRVSAPRQVVWDILTDSQRYPEWWPGYKRCQQLTPGVTGVGAAAEYVVRGPLPYEVRYCLEVTHYDPPNEVAVSAAGDLVGAGRVVYEPDGDGTLVTFFWTVRTSGFWLNLLVPVLRWLFAWNHNSVMRQGEQGIIRRLRDQGARYGPVRLLRFPYEEHPGASRRALP
jgi:uncharacterized protein YndB with AHSA1/START domain